MIRAISTQNAFTESVEILLPGLSSLPPLNALRAFSAAGSTLNFAAAAQELGVTQGAVAQQVRSLEAHLGTPLFIRLPRGLSFTDTGRAYHREIVQAFSQVVKATEILSPDSQKVTVSVTPTFASRWLIPNLPDFRKDYSDVDLRVLATEALSSFTRDGVDLVVRLSKPPFGASLSAQLLFPQKIVAVANTLLLEGRELPLRTVKGLPLVHDTHNLWPEFLREAGFDGEASDASSLEFSQTSLSIEAAIAGQGVALASEFMVRRELANGQLVQVLETVLHADRDFWLLMPRSVNQVTKDVADWILKRAENETTPAHAEGLERGS